MVRNLTLYTTCVSWWFFCGNNRWRLDIDMIMVALRLLGFEAGTERKRSGNGAGAERERSGIGDFHVFSRFSMFSCLPLGFRLASAWLPLGSRFGSAFLFLRFFCFFFAFLCFFQSFSRFFVVFPIFEYVFYFLNVFWWFFPWNCLDFLERIASFWSSPVRTSPRFFTEFDHSVFFVSGPTDLLVWIIRWKHQLVPQRDHRFW